MKYLLILAAIVTSSYGNSDWTVHFSPNGGCTKAIVETINSVKSDTILVQAYSFTSTEIATALANAAKRKVIVRIIIDEKSTFAKGCKASFCKAAGCQIYSDGIHAIAHNKIMIMNKQVWTGSFNFSEGAEHSNAENSLASPIDWSYVPVYKTNWKAHLKHSVAY